jgi:hypothetical protein
MSKLSEHLLSLLLLFTFLTSCAQTPLANGEIAELGLGATQYGLRLVQSGDPLVHALSDGRLVFAQWPLTNGLWGSVCLNCAVRDPLGNFIFKAGGRGMAMNYTTASETTQYLKENGWYEIPRLSMPAIITGLVHAYASIATAGAIDFMTIPFIPAQVLQGPQT